jgi:hypothetical protein
VKFQLRDIEGGGIGHWKPAPAKSKTLIYKITEANSVEGMAVLKPQVSVFKTRIAKKILKNFLIEIFQIWYKLQTYDLKKIT